MEWTETKVPIKSNGTNGESTDSSYPLHRCVFQSNIKELSSLIRTHDISEKDKQGYLLFLLFFFFFYCKCVDCYNEFFLLLFF